MLQSCSHRLGRPGHFAQRGVALVVSLLLLVVIALVGLAAVRAVLMQNRSASNQYDRQIAFQSSEAALRQAEVTIKTATATQNAPAGFEDCSTPASTANPNDLSNECATGVSLTPANTCLANPFADAGAASQIANVPAGSYNAGAVAASQPQYVVQYMGKFRIPNPPTQQISNSGTPPPNTPTCVDYYRITARSGDPVVVGDRSVVTLQSTFRN